MDVSLATTADGSHTLYVPALNEHYHSINGAIQESEHIFIRHGLETVSSKINPLNILEVGFGTGLNAWLSWRAGHAQKIRYVGIDPHVLTPEVLASLNYTQVLGDEKDAAFFRKINTTPWDFPYYLNDAFILFKVQDTIQEVMLGEGKFELVYFDAFSPEVQPEMWTPEVFSKIFTAMVPGAPLLTYSAKGEVKRTLKEAGFMVEALPGPPGKREITRAIKP